MNSFNLLLLIGCVLAVYQLTSGASSTPRGSTPKGSTPKATTPRGTTVPARPTTCVCSCCSGLMCTPKPVYTYFDAGATVEILHDHLNRE
ncbi:unnamed protein product [Didymodactylos carnosus]|uniref:Uncharacterized protein n=1 Tax=Didymodactylos carnosus TaxID=1234261 RepID=A0A816D5Q8_9BILA|nr:unnamed protein product [Didymodactylos carnosus]CAF4534298.1 unnamed protein product [Didymodactylos carnosus]